jgi:uncharacterized cupin superfamily protein
VKCKQEADPDGMREGDKSQAKRENEEEIALFQASPSSTRHFIVPSEGFLCMNGVLGMEWSKGEAQEIRLQNHIFVPLLLSGKSFAAKCKRHDY